MAVYVDDWREPLGLVGWSVARSHLLADTFAGLEGFADRLGLSWVSRRVEESGVWYEVGEEVRQRAVLLGAIPLQVGSPGWVSVVRRSRLWSRSTAALTVSGSAAAAERVSA